MSEIIIKTRDDLHSILSKIYYGNEDEIWSHFEKCVWKIIQENQQLKENILKSMLSSYNQGCKYTEALYKEQLKQRDEVINKAIGMIDKLDSDIMQNTILGFHQFIPRFYEIKEILKKYKGDNK